MSLLNVSNGVGESWPNVKSEYIHAFDFEVFDIPRSRLLLTEYRPWAITTCVLYVSLIYAGQLWMKSRPAYNLRSTLVIWNGLLAIFSITGLFRTFPEFFFIVSRPDGLYKSACTSDIHNYATAFWALIFTLSKLVELGDTAFVILRKQKLIFLHWYHHITVLLMTWIYYETYEPCFRWFGTMNYFVHALMYTYFTLKAMKVRVPRSLAMCVTVLQIAQMIVGLYINVYTYNIKSSGVPCDRPMGNIVGGLSIYGTYFLLFIHFFVKAYFVGPKSKTN
ncbi:unnamed protein product [Allacma fusca]|uniref:Elongation of very long chain fatty acids protein n=1 Tax=Allacma fusca TaxID=39272 RepID=A0A8J2Q0Z2_9HEXA|nr:unnamed protein product [Allacma fusca]